MKWRADMNHRFFTRAGFSFQIFVELSIGINTDLKRHTNFDFRLGLWSRDGAGVRITIKVCMDLSQMIDTSVLCAADGNLFCHGFYFNSCFYKRLIRYIFKT